MTKKTANTTPAGENPAGVSDEKTTKKKKNPRTFADLKPGDTFTYHDRTAAVIQTDPVHHAGRDAVALTYRDTLTGRQFDRILPAAEIIG